MRAIVAGLGPFAVGLVAVAVAAGPAANPDERTEERVETMPQPEAETVALLHGLGRSATHMLILKWRLESRGYRVCNIDYDTRVDSIETASDSVFASLSGCVGDAGVIHFVTHSLGGLVLRSLLARHQLANLGRAVLLAPPNQGSEIADRLGGSRLMEGLLGTLVTQLGTGRGDLPQRLPSPPIPFGVIAGDRWINPAGPWLLPAPHDGTVSVESTRLDGMADHLVLPHTHTFIMHAAGVASQVDAFLRTGRFDRGEAEVHDDRVGPTATGRR